MVLLLVLGLLHGTEGALVGQLCLPQKAPPGDRPCTGPAGSFHMSSPQHLDLGPNVPTSVTGSKPPSLKDPILRAAGLDFLKYPGISQRGFLMALGGLEPPAPGSGAQMTMPWVSRARSKACGEWATASRGEADCKAHPMRQTFAQCWCWVCAATASWGGMAGPGQPPVTHRSTEVLP